VYILVSDVSVRDESRLSKRMNISISQNVDHIFASECFIVGEPFARKKYLNTLIVLFS